MFELSMIFKIAAVGILIIIINMILRSSGKDQYAIAVNIAGIVIIMGMVVAMIVKLFDTVKTMFYF